MGDLVYWLESVFRSDQLLFLKTANALSGLCHGEPYQVVP